MSRILTGIKPTSEIHWGNYIGAIKPGLDICKTFDESLFFIADYHALNSTQNGADLKNNSYQVAASWLACGLDPKNTTIYWQSAVPELLELTWILSCFTPKGFMNRAHAYKAKTTMNREAGKTDEDAGVNMGLFNYPVLMSADILLFSADKVPVGRDQLQHIEFARDIAIKFNNKYGEILKLPEALIEDRELLPGLDGQKMSSSYNNFIPLFVPSKKLRKMVMKIKSDSTPPEAPKDPKNSLLMDIYKCFASETDIQTMTERYQKGIGWGEVKEVIFETMDKEITPYRESYEELMADPQKIDQILAEGSQKARALAAPLMKDIKETIGVFNKA